MIAASTNPGINKAIITGTPGIGKSLFLIYFLWKLVKEGKRVLFIYHPFNIYYDGNSGVFMLDKLPSIIDFSFWNDTLWCLFDAKGKKKPTSTTSRMDCARSLCRLPRDEKWLTISKNLLFLKSFSCQRGLRLSWKRLYLFFRIQLNGVTVSIISVESLDTYWKSRHDLRLRCSKQHVRTAPWMIASRK